MTDTKDQIKDIVKSFINGEEDSTQDLLHKALQTKMQQYLNPQDAFDSQDADIDNEDLEIVDED